MKSVLNIQLILNLLRSLDFIINESKSCFISLQTCKFLRFIFDNEICRVELLFKKETKDFLVSTLLTRQICKLVLA